MCEINFVRLVDENLTILQDLCERYSERSVRRTSGVFAINAPNWEFNKHLVNLRGGQCWYSDESSKDMSRICYSECRRFEKNARNIRYVEDLEASRSSKWTEKENGKESEIRWFLLLFEIRVRNIVLNFQNKSSDLRRMQWTNCNGLCK